MGIGWIRGDSGAVRWKRLPAVTRLTWRRRTIRCHQPAGLGPRDRRGGSGLAILARRQTFRHPQRLSTGWRVLSEPGTPAGGQQCCRAWRGWPGILVSQSLNALLRSEKIELAQDEKNRRRTPGVASRGSLRAERALPASGAYLIRSWENRDTRWKRSNGDALWSPTRTCWKNGAGGIARRGDAKGCDGARRSAGGGFEPDAAGIEAGRMYSEIDPKGCSVSREGGTEGLNWPSPAGARRHLYGIAQCGGDVYAHVAARACRRNPADGDTGLGCAPETAKVNRVL